MPVPSSNGAFARVHQVLPYPLSATPLTPLPPQLILKNSLASLVPPLAPLTPPAPKHPQLCTQDHDLRRKISTAQMAVSFEQTGMSHEAAQVRAQRDAVHKWSSSSAEQSEKGRCIDIEGGEFLRN